MTVLAAQAAPVKPTFRGDSQYLIDTWETEDGLPENSATAMVQTPDGYLWFGTFNGLVRFDGIRFLVLDPTNTPELPSSGIVNLYLDKSGRLWVSTYKGVVCLSMGKWTAYGATEGWSGSFVRTFAERPDGGLLVTTFDGVVLEFSEGRFRALPAPPGQRDVGYLGLIDESGQWCVVQHPLIARWDGQRWQEMTATPKETIAGELRAGPSRDGGFWLFEGRELRKQNRGSVSAPVTLRDFHGGFWSLFEDSNNNVWICTYDQGLYRVAADGSLRHWDTSNGLSYSGTRFVFEDREKNLWVGTSGGGLQRFQARRFQSVGTENGLTERVVNSVCPDAKGDTWIATYGKGLFHHTARELTNLSLPGFESRPIYGQSVLADRSGRVWMGTFGHGLWVLEDGQFRRVPDAQTGGGNVLALFEDSRGRIWISGGQGVAIHQADTHRNLEDDRLRRDAVVGFTEDQDGSIWMSNQDGVFRLKEERLEEVFDEKARPIRGVNCFKADPDGSIWMGSALEGLLRLSNGHLARIDSRMGLPIASIHGILEDGHGHFLMASNRGVIRAGQGDLLAAAQGRLAHVKCQVFDVSDGLPGIECAGGRQPVCGRDPLGKLWFATSKGVAVADPAQLRLNSVMAAAAVDQVTYFSPSRNKGAESGELKGTQVESSLRAPFDRRVILPAGTRRLAFAYTAPSFSAPQKVRFQVKLEGEDADWQDAADQRVAYYHDPRPGEYVFRVRAANGDGIWDEAGASLAFTVQPFIWQMLWFQGGSAVVLAGGGAAAAWWVAHARQRRTRQRLLRTQKESAALVRLSVSPAVTSGDLDVAFTEITELAANVLDVAQVGIWLLSDDQSELRCADLFDRRRRTHESGATLATTDYPRYFDALRGGRAIAASNAISDPRTSEFAATYLTPQNITSMLDAVVRVSGKFAGVICHEHMGPARAWVDDEIAFAGAVADQVAQTLLNAAQERSIVDLRESEQRMSLAADAAHLGMWLWRVPGNRVWMSEQCRALFGFLADQDVTYESFLSRVHPDDRQNIDQTVRRALKEERAYEAEYRLLLPGGEVRWIVSRGKVKFDEAGKASSMQGVSIDVSRRRQAEMDANRQRNELAHLSRVNMLGELSGSLAHELNQPLTAILSNAQAAQRFLAHDDADLDELREILGDIVAEDKRAGEVIQRLRLLLKKGEVQQQPLDVNEVVDDVLKLAHSDCVNQNVTVVRDLASNLPTVNADRVQLQQVILNLVVNGCDAMAAQDNKRRKLTLRTQSSGSLGVEVLVADCGPGVPPGKLEEVFEPFYTTKSHGMGLGLAVCRTIINAHGGRLWATNNADRGASFHVALPAIDGKAS